MKYWKQVRKKNNKIRNILFLILFFIFCKILTFTGQLEKLEKAKADPVQQSLNRFNRIHGIGPVTARKWIEQGIMTLAQLRTEIAAGKITLTKEQTIGLEHLEDFEKRIPRGEMDKHVELIQNALRPLDSKLQIQIVGSYRRGAESCGDIDVLLAHANFDAKAHANKQFGTYIKDVVAALSAQHYIKHQLSQGNLKFMGVCRLPESTKGVETFGEVYFRIFLIFQF